MDQGKTILILGGGIGGVVAWWRPAACANRCHAGFGSGNFLAEPAPQIALKPPGRWLHWGKVAYEKFWFYKWF